MGTSRRARRLCCFVSKKRRRAQAIFCRMKARTRKEKLHKHMLSSGDDLGSPHLSSRGKSSLRKMRMWHHAQYNMGMVVQLRDCLRKLSTKGNGVEPPCAKNVLAKRMQALWKSGQLCDMILISGQARVSCHRCVIGASSRSLLNEIAMEPWDMRSLCAIEFADTYHEQALLIVVEHMYGEFCGPKLRNPELMCLVDVCRLAVSAGSAICPD